MTVTDYNTNPTVIILVQSSWDWNLIEIHVLLFDIWMTVSDYTNSTVIILVGIGILTQLY
jgi:hypothetical protein